MAWRKGLTGVGAASVAFSGAAYYYRPDPSGELLESRRTRSPKVRGIFFNCCLLLLAFFFSTATWCAYAVNIYRRAGRQSPFASVEPYPTLCAVVEHGRRGSLVETHAPAAEAPTNMLVVQRTSSADEPIDSPRLPPWAAKTAATQ